jgi:hypothetical protein
MSISYINADLRRLIVLRADHLCEYCLIHEDDTFWGCEVDHIISEKHGDPTTAYNLAYACLFCNRAKGSDIGSICWRGGEFSRFFHPRTDRWFDHFTLSGVEIIPRTNIGEVTARILGFNHPDRLLERRTLQAVNRYPCSKAQARMIATS